ncbi:MAG: immunity 51 family protein [Oscillospiraceae bacterium]|nr:immunity 51 family protein [Oscillospiraceae bacterium]
MDYTSEEFKRKIEPFQWDSNNGQYTFYLEIRNGYLTEIFQKRADEGFLGNGYDWEALVEIFLAEIYEGDDDSFEFDSEADTFIVYSEDGNALADFALTFREACNDLDLIADLFSRAELN